MDCTAVTVTYVINTIRRFDCEKSFIFLCTEVQLILTVSRFVNSKMNCESNAAQSRRHSRLFNACLFCLSRGAMNAHVFDQQTNQQDHCLSNILPLFYFTLFSLFLSQLNLTI